MVPLLDEVLDRTLGVAGLSELGPAPEPASSSDISRLLADIERLEVEKAGLVAELDMARSASDDVKVAPVAKRMCPQ